MMIRLVLYFMLLIAAAILNITMAGAATPEEQGLVIAREAARRDDGFSDMSAEMVMKLKNRHGQESVRRMRIKALEVPGDGDKTLSIFDNPADVKGTAFLTFSHKAGDDDQWLYLPALKRVKRISSSNKSGSFMGSEFAYEDTASQEVEKYTYRYLRDEVYEGLDCFVNELHPVHPKSGYTRIVVWMDKAEYRPMKMEYYDRRNALLKTLTFKGYRLYKDKFWRADAMYMENHQTGKSTLLEYNDIRFGTGLDDGDFDRNALKRAK